MFAAIRDGQDVETYARQWKNAYTYGGEQHPARLRDAVERGEVSDGGAAGHRV